MDTKIKAAIFAMSTFITSILFVATMAGVNSGLTKVDRDDRASSARYTDDGVEIVVQVANL